MPDLYVFSLSLLIFTGDGKQSNNLMPLSGKTGISESFISVNKLHLTKDEARLPPLQVINT